ncbi:uncharacterized protein LOC143226311 isoform X1 [Tachypleus tridentatus]|uniref:uncharacterized protein LOC143226311 isoform X1 n=1 Tax=Tachypleus tridentatus TaxID=6853 RepID=UPI003FD6043E
MADEGSNATEAAKRGRGRPKKADKPEESSKDVKEEKQGRGRPQKADPQKEFHVLILQSTEEPPVKRSRGRPKGTFKKKGGKQSAPVSGRGRGRPKKSDVTAKEDVENDAE